MASALDGTIPLETVFVSDNANSFYSVTRRHEPTVLRQFNRVRANAPLHVQSNMPGKLMLLYALQLVSTRTDVLPWLVIGLSNLGAILVYLFVRDLFDDSRTAFVAGARTSLCRPAIFLPASEHGDPDRHSDLWMAARAMVADGRDRLRGALMGLGCADWCSSNHCR